MSSDFYTSSILPYSGIIIKICRAYTDSQEDFEDYYQEVCLQIWRSKDKFRGDSKWSTWIYRLSLNICLTLIKKKKKTRQYFNNDAVNQYEEGEENSAFSNENLNFLSRFTADNLSRDNKYNIGSNLIFRHDFDNNANLTFNAHYTTYDYERDQNVLSNFFDQSNAFEGSSEFNTLANQDTEIITGKVDYNLPIDETSSFD